MMGEGGERVEAEHRPRTLQCVKAAKHLVDEIAVVEPVAEIEQPLLDLLEQFSRLDQECRRGIGLAHRPSTLRATLTSCSGTNGLTSQPVAPAVLACCFIESSDSVVRKMIGNPRRAGDVRS